MRRLTPRRASNPWPADPPLRPPVRALRVTKDFSCEGLRFREGQLLSPDSPIAQAIHREFPKYLPGALMAFSSFTRANSPGTPGIVR
jgi:hypothetical protein